MSPPRPDHRPRPAIDEAQEARDNAAYLASLDPAIAAAAAWHTRCEDGLDSDETIEFQRWLRADPGNANAYSRLDRSVSAVRKHGGALSAPGRVTDSPEAAATTGARSTTSASLPASAAGRLARSTARRPAARTSDGARRRYLALAASLLLAAVALGWYAWRQPVFSSQFATGQGQRLTVALPDGSELLLDAATRAEANLYRRRREIRLDEGQVMLSVSRQAERPFVVLAGPARISVVGTRFSVRYTRVDSQSGSAEVAVEHGRVVVQSSQAATADDPGRGSTTLQAGEAVRVSAGGEVGEVTTVPTGAVAAWRKGLVRFSNTTLADAIAELERYGPTSLIVRDPAVAGLRLGGSFATDRPAELASILPSLLPVRLLARSDGRWEVVAAR